MKKYNILVLGLIIGSLLSASGVLASEKNSGATKVSCPTNSLPKMIVMAVQVWSKIPSKTKKDIKFVVNNAIKEGLDNKTVQEQVLGLLQLKEIQDAVKQLNTGKKSIQAKKNSATTTQQKAKNKKQNENKPVNVK